MHAVPRVSISTALPHPRTPFTTALRAGVVTPALVSGCVSETGGYIKNSYCYDRYDVRMLRAHTVSGGEGALYKETSTKRQTRRIPTGSDNLPGNPECMQLYFRGSRDVIRVVCCISQGGSCGVPWVHACPPMRLGTCYVALLEHATRLEVYA